MGEGVSISAAWVSISVFRSVSIFLTPHLQLNVYLFICLSVCSSMYVLLPSSHGF